jgi:hypothetical protein
MSCCSDTYSEWLMMRIVKILRSYRRSNDEVELVGQLVKPWCAFEGASSDVWSSMGDEKKAVSETRGSALEVRSASQDLHGLMNQLAIVTQAKHFLSLPLIQHLITEIYLGHLIYSPTSSRSLISDSYVSERTLRRRQSNASQSSRNSHAFPASTGSHRHKLSVERGETEKEELSEVYVYNPFEAGWLDHQRLRVPKWRKWLEFGSFAVLIALYIATLASTFDPYPSYLADILIR